MSKVVHFEIPADDMDRATRFYQETFGWRITGWEGTQEYRMIEAGPSGEMGIDGGLMKRTDSDHVVMDYISVASVDQAMADIRANGGEIVTPKMPVPGMGYFAQFRDTEGNILGVFQNDTSAK